MTTEELLIAIKNMIDTHFGEVVPTPQGLIVPTLNFSCLENTVKFQIVAPGAASVDLVLYSEGIN